MASTYLTRTLTGTGSNTIFTYSAWLKRSNITSDIPRFFEAYNVAAGGSLYYSSIRFRTDQNNELEFYSEISGSPCQLRTNRVFRDTNAWYHIVLTVDTTNATADDRMKLWINGVQETSFSIRTNPGLNQSLNSNNSGNIIYLGRKSYDPTDYFNGLMTHVHFIDGTAYDASDFGETDATTGIWKPKTAPSVTYGTNGFFLKFENSGSMGTDSSGNANNFTVNGNLTQTVDTPSNVFATLNPLALPGQTSSFSNGNTKAQTATAVASNQVSTLAVSSGKYYWEIKCDAISSDEDPFIFGIMEVQSYPTSRFSVLSTGYGYKGFTGQKVNTNVSSSYGDAYAVGDIISVAVDLDNNYIYFAKNGTWQNSGDPTSGASGTGAAFNITSGTYFAAQCCESSTRNVTYSMNFGNGYFGTTAVSSAQNPDDGIGIFEYDVPTGYRALCTKSINAEEYA